MHIYRSFFFFCDLVFFFVLVVFGIFFFHPVFSYANLVSHLVIFIPVFFVSTFFLWLCGFYNMRVMEVKYGLSVHILVAFAASALVSVSGIYFLFPLLHIITPRRVLVFVLVLYFVYVYLIRRFEFKFVRFKVYVFGESETISEIVTNIKKFRIYEIAVLEPFPDPLKRYDISDGAKIVVGSKLFREHPESWPVVCKDFIARGFGMTTDFNFFSRLFCRLSYESINDDMWFLRGVGNRTENNEIYDSLKRLTDLIIALTLLIPCAAVGAVIYLLILAIDRYQPIFVQKREGLMGRSFDLYKFQTIVPATRESPEEKVTKLGALLRRFRLDEIPQLINVFNGTLSFVGPRPLWIGEIPLLNKNIPYHSLRTIVKPGITGWAQLNYKAPPNHFILDKEAAPEDEVYESAMRRFSYDIWYIKNRSFFLDLGIIIRTGIRMFIKDK